MFKHKKTVIVITIIVIVLLIVFLLSKKSNSVVLTPYEKYEMSIIVTARKEDDLYESSSIRFRFDGKNGKISSENNEIDAYLVGDEIRYLKENTIYTYTPKYFYDDVNELLPNIRTADKLEGTDEYNNYSTVLDNKTLNKLLAAICFEKRGEEDVLVNFTVKNRHISSMSFTISDIDDYESVNVMFHLYELDETFKINTSKVIANSNNHYLVKPTTENIFSIIR